MNPPLAGISVLDIGTLTPGKFCTAMLADMGASVLRVERPAASRDLADEDLLFNRGKKLMTLDLRAEAGREILCRLAELNDVVFEGYRPGVTRRLGIDYEVLKDRNPRLVYCSLSGFGQDGPCANRPGYDLQFVAASGVLSAFAGAGNPPAVPGAYLSDAVSGLTATVAICAALVRQQKIGAGCYIDLAMLDSVFLLLSVSHGILRPGHAREEANPAASPFYNIYETRDGRYLALGAIRPDSCKALCRELGRPELGERQPANAGERAELFAFLSQAFRRATAAEWVSRLAALDIEIAAVNTPQQAFTDPQLVARGLVVDAVHPRAGRFQRIGNPIGFKPERGEGQQTAAPTPGQNTEEVLRELGYASAAIARLREQGVI
jgi:alpha-methylacyl-CoA racemase